MNRKISGLYMIFLAIIISLAGCLLQAKDLSKAKSLKDDYAATIVQVCNLQ